MTSEIVLDPSQENVVPEQFSVVDTEIEFLRLDGTEERLWIRGEYLCRWVNDLYRARGSHPHVMVKELRSPRMRLRALIGGGAEELNRNASEQILEILDHAPGLSLDQVLTRITGNDLWSEPPSIENGAKWLLAEFDDDLLPLVEAQRERWRRSAANEELRTLYEVPHSLRKSRLKEWLLADESYSLGVFPFAVEGESANLLQEEWGRRLRATRGAAIEGVSSKNPNASQIARSAKEYFSHNANYLTPAIAARISPFLAALDRAHLERLIPKTRPSPLATDATVEHALSWVVKEYLPYRQWQVYTSLHQSNEVEELGESFTDWLLNTYPKLTTRSRDESSINLRAHYLVSELAKAQPVLWVVVDGLNYINHQLLLRLLGQSHAELRITEDLAVLSILPTITAKAKYSMTSGLFPRENRQNHWDVQKTFQAAFPNGEYAGDAQVDRLHSALADETMRVCYWNMTAIDAYYHKQTDPRAIGPNIEYRLQALAEIVSDLVMRSLNRDRIAVVISTDHGQMLGPCSKLDATLKNITVHGRTAYGNLFDCDPESSEPYLKSPEDSMVVLNPVAFQLDESTTLALKSFYFGGWTTDTLGRAWGVHGGLYPEEVVVGLSVLTRQPNRTPVTATISGKGEAGKPGSISLFIDNPNAAPVSAVTLFINELEEFANGLPVLSNISQSAAEEVSVAIKKFPSPRDGDVFPVSGSLLYEFEDGIQLECKVTGTLNCKQMYTGQRPSLDRFKR